MTKHKGFYNVDNIIKKVEAEGKKAEKCFITLDKKGHVKALGGKCTAGTFKQHFKKIEKALGAK